jgi:hypothetical protein
MAGASGVGRGAIDLNRELMAAAVGAVNGRVGLGAGCVSWIG